MHERQQEPIQLQTPFSLLSWAKTLLERHGCQVEKGHVTLPVGSIRTLRPRTLQTITLWYDIVLPDQYQMLEAHERYRELSMLYLPPR